MANAFEEQQGFPEVDEVTIDPIIDAQVAEMNNRIAVLRSTGLHATANLFERRRDELLRGKREPEEG